MKRDSITRSRSHTKEKNFRSQYDIILFYTLTRIW